MRRVTAWTLGALLVLVIFGALGAAAEALRANPNHRHRQHRQPRQPNEEKRKSNSNSNSNSNPNPKFIMEGMTGGLNVTSDDLVGYAESNAYSDSGDAKMYGDISWKIKKCSTITQADLNRAVNDAVTKAKSNCRRGYYE
jgi:hypothetical protein